MLDQHRVQTDFNAPFHYCCCSLTSRDNRDNILLILCKNQDRSTEDMTSVVVTLG